MGKTIMYERIYADLLAKYRMEITSRGTGCHRRKSQQSFMV